MIAKSAVRWCAVSALGIVYIGSFYQYGVIGPLANLLHVEGYADSDIGLLQVYYHVPGILGALISGRIADRYSIRLLIVTLSALCLAGTAIMRIDPHWIGIGRLVLGFGLEPLCFVVLVAIARLCTSEQTPLAQGIVLACGRLGLVLADLSPGWAPKYYLFWKNPLVLSLYFGMATVVAAILYTIFERMAATTTEIKDGENRQVRWDRHVHSTFWILLILACSFNASILTFRSLGQDFMIRVFHLLQPIPADYMSITTLIPLFLTPIAGAFLSWIRAPRIVVFLGMLMLLMGFLFLSGHFQSGKLLLLGVVLIGVSYAVVPVALWSSVSDVVPKSNLGTGFAIIMASLNAAAALTGYVGGWFETRDGVRSLLIVLSSIAALGVLVSIVWLRTDRQTVLPPSTRTLGAD
jgi:predicted MFS family arabinose efflux permease